MKSSSRKGRRFVARCLRCQRNHTQRANSNETVHSENHRNDNQSCLHDACLVSDFLLIHAQDDHRQYPFFFFFQGRTTVLTHNMLIRILQRFGYKVLCTKSSLKALMLNRPPMQGCKTANPFYPAKPWVNQIPQPKKRRQGVRNQDGRAETPGSCRSIIETRFTFPESKTNMRS